MHSEAFSLRVIGDNWSGGLRGLPGPLPGPLPKQAKRLSRGCMLVGSVISGPQTRCSLELR